MKRLTATMFALCIVAMVSMAQQSKSLINLTQEPALTGTTENTSALQYRLTGIKSFNMNAGVWEDDDSLALEYSGTRGSDIMNEILDFNKYTNYEWDGFVYTPTDRELKTFNSNDQVREHEIQNFNGATWDDDYRDVTAYNGNGKVASETRQDYNGGVWEDNYRYVYTYNNGRLAARTNQDWNGSNWENDWRYVYTYDGSGNQNSRIVQDWNGSSWEDQYRNLYTHDGSGNQLQDLRQNWNGSSWDDNYRYNMQYDGQGWMTSRTRQNWNGSSWEDDWRNLFTHNSGDYYYSEIVRQNFTGGAWENDTKSEYDFTSFNKISQYIGYNWDGSLWEGNLKQIVYYEEYDDGSTGIESSSELGVQVFPNPAADYVMFRNNGSEKSMHIEVYNMEGRLITKLSGTSHAKWNTSSTVASGLYNYVVTIGSEKQSGQIVIH